MMKKPKPVIYMYMSFGMGILLATFWRLLIQDFHGKEAYIKLIKEGWFEMHWAWWIIPIITTMMIYNKIISKFVKLTTWMTLLNGGPKTEDTHNAQSLGNWQQSNRPPPPPPPPKRSSTQSSNPVKPLTEGKRKK